MSLTQEQINQGYSTIAGSYDPVTGKLNSQSFGVPYAPITPGSLVQETPFKLPPPSVSGAEGLLGNMESNTAAFATAQGEQAKQVEAAGTATGKSLQDYLTAALGTQGQTELTGQAYSQGGVDTAKKELDEINQQIVASQVANRRQVEAVMKGGGPEDFIRNTVNDINRRDAVYQADLSVISMAKQNNYFGAKEIADRAVAIQFEKQTQRNETLRFLYEENKEKFNKMEQRQFETAQRERERQLEEQKENKKMILGFSAEAAKIGNAPMLILQRAGEAKTPMEALQLLAPYLSDPNEKAQALLDIELSKERIKSESSGRTLAEEKFKFEKDMALEELGLKRAKQEFDMSPSGNKAADAKEYQYKANLFVNRLADANTALDGLQGYVVKANPALFSAQTVAEGSTIGNALVPSEVQQVRQAQRNFINAVLRRESGAVISPSEFAEGNRQYFPRPGDSQGVLQQKAQNRNAVIQSLSSEAGPALQRYEMTAQPKTIEYQGKKYSVDAQGNMQPI